MAALAPLEGHPASQLNVEVAFDGAGTRLVSAGEDGLRIWSAEEGACLRTIPGHTSGFAIAGTATVIAGYKDRAVLWDLETGAALASWPTGWDWVEGLAVDPEGREVWIVDDSDAHVHRYDRATGARLEPPEALRAARAAPLAFSPSGALHYSDSYNRLNAWDPATGETWKDERKGLVARLDWSVDGAWMVAVAWEWPSIYSHPWEAGWIRLYGPDGARRSFGAAAYDAAIGPHGRLVALARGADVLVLDATTGETLARLEARSTVTGVDIGADYLLAAGTSSGAIRRWRLTP